MVFEWDEEKTGRTSTNTVSVFRLRAVSLRMRTFLCFRMSFTACRRIAASQSDGWENPVCRFHGTQRGSSNHFGKKSNGIGEEAV